MKCTVHLLCREYRIHLVVVICERMVEYTHHPIEIGNWCCEDSGPEYCSLKRVI